MPRKVPKIKTRSFVKYKGKDTEVKDLPPEAREYVCSWLAATLLNLQKRNDGIVFYPAHPYPREEQEHEQLQAP